MRAIRNVLLLYTLLGLALWPIPLFNLLHVESSAVVAFVVFFVAGLSSLRLFDSGWAFGRALMWHEAALLVPWLLLTVTVFWVPNCGYAQGMLFFLLFPVVTVVLAVALAYAISGTRWRSRKAAFVAIGLAIALLTPLYDLGLHPQFYTYNHVFGGVLGPIYDEELVIRPGLFAFRSLSLLWAGLAWVVGAWLRERERTKEWERRGVGERRQGAFLPGPSARRVFIPGFYVLIVLIGGCYVLSGHLGINTPAWKIERTLGSVHHTAHFDIYYDAEVMAPGEVRWLADDHEYRYAQLSGQLKTQVPRRIASYIYPDEETKAQLTGARSTNVAPVWLWQPQAHVLQTHYEQVFPHELVHVFSREFGLPVVRASAAVGLVEGLAVALEPPDGLPSPHEQVAVALQLEHLDEGARLVDNLAAGLSPLGFWSGRGAVSYTTMGSFVRFLLDAYGAERLKQVYAWAEFEEVYGVPVETLAAQWQAYLQALPVIDRSAADVVLRRFTVPSLLEKRCPHHVPSYRRYYREGEQALAAGDTVRAQSAFEEALCREPAYTTALAAWAHLALAAGRTSAVIARLDTLTADQTTPVLAVRLGDALAAEGHAEQAREHYHAALSRLPAYAHEQRALVVLRIGLAQEAEAVRLLTSGLMPAEQADRLASLTSRSPALVFMRALRLGEAESYQEAALLLRSHTIPDAWSDSEQNRRVVRQQQLRWLAQLAYRAGDIEAAQAYAQHAAEMYRSYGDHNAAAFSGDFAEKMGWLREHPSHAFAP